MDPLDQPDFEQFPLIDAIDHEILMHRDAQYLVLGSNKNPKGSEYL